MIKPFKFNENNFRILVELTDSSLEEIVNVWNKKSNSFSKLDTMQYIMVIIIIIICNTVLLKDNVANERLSSLVSRSNSHTTQESKRTELKPL